jgi:hypothetical protein
MRAHRLIFILLVALSCTSPITRGAGPQIEISAHVSREDVRQIIRVIGARTRQPVYGIYPHYFETRSTISDREFPAKFQFTPATRCTKSPEVPTPSRSDRVYGELFPSATGYVKRRI